MTAHHSYLRDLASPESNSLVRLATWIPRGATVLELGPASGYFTRHMAQALGCTVDAVERDAAMAERARAWCRRMEVADLEAIRLQETFGRGVYDVVVLADVLEHLREPGALLEQLPGLLAPGGQIVVSVPNIAYAGVVAELLAGRFEYRDEGLLDRTHLRFFTRSSIDALLRGAGFIPWSWQTVFRPLGESEFAARMESLPPALVAALQASPHSLCYQWLIAARTQAPQGVPDEPPPCGADAFPVRLFWASRGQGYDYERSALAWAEIGGPRQTVRFELSGVQCDGLRLRLADRAGYVHLYSVRLVAPDGQPRWCWDRADGVARLATAWHGLHLHDAHEHAAALLDGGESWLELAATDLAGASAIEVEMGWPMSADYLAARDGWSAAVADLERQLDRVKALVDERDRLLAQRTHQMEERERLIVERDELLALRTAQLDEHGRELAACRERLDEQERRIAEMHTLEWWLRRPWNRLRNGR